MTATPIAIATATITTYNDGTAEIGLWTVIAPSPAPTPPSGPLLGVYTGNINPTGVAAFETLTGADIAIACDYQDGSTWATISSGVFAEGWKGSGYRLQLGVPMLPQGANTSAALIAGAGGTYNTYFAALAENLVAAGAANAILRIGWEWDVAGRPWYVGNVTDAANYAKFFGQIVETMQAVPGANFDYSWYMGAQGNALAVDAYPAAQFVTSISLDFYDQTWTGSCGLAYSSQINFTEAQHTCAWNNGQLAELNAAAAFAKTQNRPLRITECGVINRSDFHGGGDDPWWITDLFAWIKTNPVVISVSYFNFNSGGDSILSPTDHPLSLAAFKTAAG